VFRIRDDEPALRIGIGCTVHRKWGEMGSTRPRRVKIPGFDVAAPVTAGKPAKAAYRYCSPSAP